MVLQSMVDEEWLESNSNSSIEPVKWRRQRLTHLSPQEKANRRRIKNRVAAQNARDRQKAKMAQLQQRVPELEQKQCQSTLNEINSTCLQVELQASEDGNCCHICKNGHLLSSTGFSLSHKRQTKNTERTDYRWTLDSREKVGCVLPSGNEEGLETGPPESATVWLCLRPLQVQAKQVLNLKSPNWKQAFTTLQPVGSSKQECQEFVVQVQLVKGGFPVPDAALATQGPPSILLEVVDEATHVEHNYTKSVEEVSDGHSSDCERGADEKTDEASFPVVGKEVFINDDSAEVIIACCNSHSQTGDDLCSRTSSPALSHLDKEVFQWDSDRWPPSSDMLSVLYDGSSLDMDACELFPQLKPI